MTVYVFIYLGFTVYNSYFIQIKTQFFFLKNCYKLQKNYIKDLFNMNNI